MTPEVRQLANSTAGWIIVIGMVVGVVGLFTSWAVSIGGALFSFATYLVATQLPPAPQPEELAAYRRRRD